MKNFLILGTILVIIFVVFSMSVKTSEAPPFQMAPQATTDTIMIETNTTVPEETVSDDLNNKSI
jgi:hypothetical protein